MKFVNINNRSGNRISSAKYSNKTISLANVKPFEQRTWERRHTKNETVPWQFGVARLMFGWLGTLIPKRTSQYALKLFSTPRRRSIPKREQGVLDDAQPVQIYHGELELEGYMWGEGPVIVLVHGWEGRATNLGAFVPPLVEKGYRVVSFDGPAHGNSPGKRTNLVDFGEAIREVIKEIGTVHGIIGHSFGAASTILALIKRPKPAVEKIVLVGSPSELQDVIGRFATFLNLPEQVIRNMYGGLYILTGKPVEFFSVRARAPSLKIPALVVHDRTDQEIPFSDAEKIVSEWSEATLMATEGLGHKRILREPRVVEKVVKFLAGEQ